MYYYLYDLFLNDKKYDKLLARIESRLTDLGINGKIGRLTMLKNVDELVQDEISRGAKTVVAVGNDKTLCKVLNGLAKSDDVVLGFIPIGSGNDIAKDLGIDLEEAACDILSARKIEKIDLGKANGQYFLSNVQIKSGQIELEFDKGYKVIPVNNNEVVIYNLASSSIMLQNKFINPQDGWLETLVEPKRPGLIKLLNIFLKSKKFKKIGGRSVFPTKKLVINSSGPEPVPVLIDNEKVLKTPVKIEIAPKKLKMVVGKNRLF